MSVVDSDLFPATFAEVAINRRKTTQKGLNCHLVTFDARPDYEGEIILLEVGKDEEFHVSDDKHIGSDPALVVTRHFSSNHVMRWKELKIKSIHMQKILQDCITGYPGVDMHNDPITFKDSPWCLFFYFDKLEEHGRTLQDPIAVQHLVFLLRYIDHLFHSAREAYDLVMKQPESTAAMGWADLWTIFRPGTLVFWETPFGVPIVSRVENMTKCECSAYCEDCGIWRVTTLNIEFTGNRYEWIRHTIPLGAYDGSRRLHTLRVFPLKYHLDQTGVFARLVKRGEKFLSLSKMHHMQYSGTAWIDRLEQRVPCKSRFIIDNAACARTNPSLIVRYDDALDAGFDITFGNRCHFRVNPTLQIAQNKGERPTLSDDEVVCCTPSIPGFSLKYKTWTILDVEEISEIEFNEYAFDKLLLPEKQKGILKALVTPNEGKRVYEFEDIITGKGKGLIFLLHGVPGTGKTLTAGLWPFSYVSSSLSATMI